MEHPRLAAGGAPSDVIYGRGRRRSTQLEDGDSPPVQMKGDVVYFDVCVFLLFFGVRVRPRARTSQHL